MPDATIVTRFAPSPTGALHVGGARTALFNWAFARQHGGQFILRIEDTDVARSTVGAARGILRDLTWLGLDWNGGPDPHADDPFAVQLGERGPYFQSQRREIYHRYLQQLREAGRVYDDDGAIRFRMPDRDMTVPDLVLGDVTVQRGQPQLEDFVIFKSEAGGGGPTFHFANVIDDHEMGITHVIRGQEHLNNTVKHLALFDALGLIPPKYAHIPLIFNPDGSKMSKRDKAKAARRIAEEWCSRTGNDVRKIAATLATEWRAFIKSKERYGEPVEDPSTYSMRRILQFFEEKIDDQDVAQLIALHFGLALPEIDVDDFRRTGYLPEVLVNYLALLGWNPGGDVERFGPDPLGFLRERFSLDRVQKAHAKFDRDKLYRFNHEAITALPADVFRDKLREHLRTYHPEFGALCDDDRRFTLFAEAYQPRTHVLSEPAELGRFFVVERIDRYDDRAVQKNLAKNDGEGFTVLRELRDRLDFEPWSGAAAHERMQALAEAKGLGMGKIAQPLRVALTGSTVSPPIDVTLEILGKAATLRRIDACLAALSPSGARSAE